MANRSSTSSQSSFSDVSNFRVTEERFLNAIPFRIGAIGPLRDQTSDVRRAETSVMRRVRSCVQCKKFHVFRVSGQILSCW